MGGWIARWQPGLAVNAGLSDGCTIPASSGWAVRFVAELLLVGALLGSAFCYSHICILNIDRYIEYKSYSNTYLSSCGGYGGPCVCMWRCVLLQEQLLARGRPHLRLCASVGPDQLSGACLLLCYYLLFLLLNSCCEFHFLYLLVGCVFHQFQVVVPLWLLHAPFPVSVPEFTF